MGMIERVVLTEEDTANIAKELVSMVKVPMVIALDGDLGVGKTFFTGCLINELLTIDGLKKETVVSPTFNLVKIYELKNFSIYHYDLYRLKRIEEIYELDLETAMKQVTIIEWSALIDDLLPKETIKIKIILNGDNRIFLLNEKDGWHK
jgi:tRNA threonylcarbamoyladenosine biosynthesis protein TsaE